MDKEKGNEEIAPPLFMEVPWPYKLGAACLNLNVNVFSGAANNKMDKALVDWAGASLWSCRCGVLQGVENWSGDQNAWGYLATKKTRTGEAGEAKSMGTRRPSVALLCPKARLWRRQRCLLLRIGWHGNSTMIRFESLRCLVELSLAWFAPLGRRRF